MFQSQDHKLVDCFLIGVFIEIFIRTSHLLNSLVGRLGAKNVFLDRYAVRWLLML